MNKNKLKKKIVALMEEMEENETTIKELVWKNYYDVDKPMSEPFAWKKTLRDELGIVI